MALTHRGMTRALAAIALLTTTSGGGGGASPAPAPTPTPPAVVQTSRNVLFVGGSITAGAGATGGRGYADQLGEWLKTKFDTVTVKNIAIGGTASQFGAYRLDNDLAGFVPDIAFIEFVQNDLDNKAFVYAYTDAIIYKLKQVNPKVAIVYVATSSVGEEALRRAGSRDPRAAYAEQVTTEDNGLFIDASSDLWKQVIEQGSAAQSFFVDTVHLNDTGHASYFGVIKAALEPIITTLTGAGPTMTRYIAQTHLETARLAATATLASNNTCQAITSTDSQLDVGLDCGKGDSFTLSFSGTAFGFVRRMAPDGGQLKCTLDGAAINPISFFDRYAATSTRTVANLELTNLALQPHVLTRSVQDVLISNGGEQSTGHHVVIGKLLVSEERPLQF